MVQDSEFGEAIIRWVLEEFKKLDVIYSSVSKLLCKPLRPVVKMSEQGGPKAQLESHLSPSLVCTCGLAQQDTGDSLCTCRLSQLDPASTINSQESKDNTKNKGNFKVNENVDKDVDKKTNAKQLIGEDGDEKSKSENESETDSAPVLSSDSLGAAYLAHVIDVGSMSQAENHELAMKAILDNRTIILDKIDKLTNNMANDNQKSSLNDLKDNIRDLQVINKELQAKLSHLKGMPAELEKAREIINLKEITIKSLEKDLESSRNLWELEKQMLKGETNLIISQRDTLEELVDQLKERIKYLNNANEHRLGGDWGNQDIDQKEEFPVKYDEGLNPVLSALCPLEPALIWKNQPFNSAEAAFHVEKLEHAYCELSDDEKERMKKEIMAQSDPLIAKKIGDKIPSTKEWLRDEGKIMENIQKAKRDQFHTFREELDKTKHGVITHPVHDSKWRNLFPKILERIRDGNNDTKAPDMKNSWQRVWGKHRTSLVGDGLVERISPSTFAKDTGISYCYTTDDFLEFANECQENRNAEIVMVAVGIEDIKSGSDPHLVADKVTQGLDILRKKCPNAKICYSQMVIKSSSNKVNMVMEANQLINTHCKDKFYVCIKHDRLMQSPNMFTNQLESGGIDEFQPTDMGLYISKLKRELPPRVRSPSPSPYKKNEPITNNQYFRPRGSRRARPRVMRGSGRPVRSINGTRGGRGNYGQY